MYIKYTLNPRFPFIARTGFRILLLAAVKPILLVPLGYCFQALIFGFTCPVHEPQNDAKMSSK